MIRITCVLVLVSGWLIAGSATATPPTAPEPAPKIETLTLAPMQGDICQRPDRSEPATTCVRLAHEAIAGLGTFEVYDLESWHWLWVVIRTKDQVFAGALGDYGSRSSAGHARAVHRFAAQVRRFAYDASIGGVPVHRVEAGLVLDFDVSLFSEAAHETSTHERVFASCGRDAVDPSGASIHCRVVGFGYSHWDKHDCTASGWAKSAGRPRIDYACTLQLIPEGAY
jgi:hypothetical protein